MGRACSPWAVSWAAGWGREMGRAQEGKKNWGSAEVLPLFFFFLFLFLKHFPK